MTIRQLALILLSINDLDKEVRVSDNGAIGQITSLIFDNDNNFIIGTSGYNEDKLTVRTEIEVKSPYSKEPKIF